MYRLVKASRKCQNQSRNQGYPSTKINTSNQQKSPKQMILEPGLEPG